MSKHQRDSRDNYIAFYNFFWEYSGGAETIETVRKIGKNYYGMKWIKLLADLHEISIQATPEINSKIFTITINI